VALTEADRHHYLSRKLSVEEKNWKNLKDALKKLKKKGTQNAKHGNSLAYELGHGSAGFPTNIRASALLK